MTLSRLIIESQERVGGHSRVFDVSDAKGRKIGAQFVVIRAEYVASEGQGYLREPGVWFTMRPHATRDMKTFGALQPQQFFRTLDEACAAGEAYIARAAKRAYRKASK